jgi:hypothetical protein
MPEREREREREKRAEQSGTCLEFDNGVGEWLNAKFARVEIGVFQEIQLGPISISSPPSSHFV